MNEQEIFVAALQQAPDHRNAYLDKACGADVAVRQRVEKLLAAFEHAGSFLASPAIAAPNDATTDNPDERGVDSELTGSYGASPATTTNLGQDAQVGAMLGGRYKLIQEIGEGGMGSVFMAQQTEPVKRAVAVKVIKAGMDSKAVLARFEAERQALALMDHPNIARVLDAGTTDGGRPFFVMELVKGKPITHYCDEHRLTPRQRLELFVPVCFAIQHAHQKGIIHRDIKPSNVLIAMYDDRPVPKVIDFGVAKATGATLTDMTLMTGFGAVVGTPEYMSPEQANLNNVDIDTRSDVYSLGVLLYELLTGSTPVDRKSLGKAAMMEILRIVREVDAPPPSAKLSTIDTLPSVAAMRGMEPAKLSRLMKGELDWVVLKALEKDRTRRYDTANGLARDIQRYLADEVVEARPPSTSYRLQKFVRRHKGQVIAASLVLLALLAGMAGTTWQAFRAEEARVNEANQRVVAEENERLAIAAAEKERDARLDEERERKYAQAIADFVRNDFLALTSIEGQDRFGGAGLDRKATLLDLLNRAAKKLKERKDLDPRIEAELNWIIGVNYRGAGEPKQGVPFLERAVQLRESLFGRDHHDTLNAVNSLGVAYLRDGQYAKALPLLDETFTRFKKMRGPDHFITLSSMNNLAAVYQDLGQLDKAVALYEQALELRKATLGPDDSDTLTSMNNLASGYRAAGNPKKALPLYEESYRLMKTKLGPDHAHTLSGLSNLASAYQDAGNLDKALPLYEESVTLRKAKLGPEHPDTLGSINNLAGAYRKVGKLDKSIELFEETIPLLKAKLGPEHPDTLRCIENLASAYREGNPNKAIGLFEEVLKVRKANLGPDHPDTLLSMGNLATCYRVAGQPDKALPLMEETLALMRVKLGPEHPSTLTSIGNLGSVYKALGKFDKAVPLVEEAFRLFKAKRGQNHPETLNSMVHLAGLYLESGQIGKALPLYEETIVLLKTNHGSDHPDTLHCMANLAGAYWTVKRLDKSVPLFEESLRLQRAKLGPKHPDTLQTTANLGVNYKDAGRVPEAIPLLEEAYQASKTRPPLRWITAQLLDAYAKTRANTKSAELLAEARKTLPKESPQLAVLLSAVGPGLMEQNMWLEAEPIIRECLAIREKTQPAAWTTFNTKSLLGGVLIGQKKYADAEPLLLAGYEGVKQREKSIPPQGKVRVPEAIDRLIELYTATNKPDEVTKWQAERAKYPVK